MIKLVEIVSYIFLQFMEIRVEVYRVTTLGHRQILFIRK